MDEGKLSLMGILGSAMFKEAYWLVGPVLGPGGSKPILTDSQDRNPVTNSTRSDETVTSLGLIRLDWISDLMQNASSYQRHFIGCKGFIGRGRGQ